MIGIVSLIYRSKAFADSTVASLYENTPQLQDGRASFHFVANDPTPELLDHLREKRYPHVVQRNEIRSRDELFAMGYGTPEYIHRVYRGWNRAIASVPTRTVVVLVNSDHEFSPGWLDGLLKHLTVQRIVTSKLVERDFMRFPGSVAGDFGNHPSNFRKQEFLDFVRDLKARSLTGTHPGGSYMPCAFYRQHAVAVGGYPEGNIAGADFDHVIEYGDQHFFRKLSEMIGVEHVTSLDSLVYHYKEGEQREGQ